MNETSNSRAAALLAHAQMLREYHHPTEEEEELAELCRQRSEIACIKQNATEALNAQRVIQQVAIAEKRKPDSLPVRVAAKLKEAIFQKAGKTLSPPPQPAGKQQQIAPTNQLAFESLSDIEAAAAKQDLEVREGDIRQREQLKARRRPRDFALIRKLLLKCIEICRQQSKNITNTRNLGDVQGTACMELASMTARFKGKAINVDPDARLWLEQAKQCFLLLDSQDIFRYYNMACWCSLMERADDCKKHLDSVANRMRENDSELYLKMLVDPDLRFARKQPWWNNYGLELLRVFVFARTVGK